MVCFEKCQGTATPGYEEDKVSAACRAVKAVRARSGRDPRLACIQYLNSELSFSGYRLFDRLKARPDYWLRAPDCQTLQRQHLEDHAALRVCSGSHGPRMPGHPSEPSRGAARPPRARGMARPPPPARLVVLQFNTLGKHLAET
eukprot:gene7653-7444_t